MAIDAIPAKTTYLMETRDGEQRKVAVPSHWRVTFGPTVPFERKSGAAYDGGTWALRFYDGKELKAIFTDVRSFREMESIEILEKRVKVQRQSMNKGGKKGGRSVVAEARIEDWVNPDDPEADKEEEDYLQLDWGKDAD